MSGIDPMSLIERYSSMIEKYRIFKGITNNPISEDYIIDFLAPVSYQKTVFDWIDNQVEKYAIACLGLENYHKYFNIKDEQEQESFLYSITSDPVKFKNDVLGFKIKITRKVKNHIDQQFQDRLEQLCASYATNIKKGTT